MIISYRLFVWFAVVGKADFSRLQRVNFYLPDVMTAVCRGCDSFRLQSESAILKTSVPRKSFL